MFDHNILLSTNYNCKKKIVVNQGGTNSMKTHTILRVLMLKAIQEKCTITVVSRDIPNLKKGAMRDMENIIAQNDKHENNSWLWPHLKGGTFEKAWNISDRKWFFDGVYLL